MSTEPDRAAVAQLDRASGFEPEGRGFESLRPRQSPTKKYFHSSACGQKQTLGRRGPLDLDISIIRKVSYDFMKSNQVIAALGALAHEHRLAVVSAAGARGPKGSPQAASQTASDSFHPRSRSICRTCSAQVCITQRREGRQLIYSTDFGVMNSVVVVPHGELLWRLGRVCPLRPGRAAKTRRTRTAA